LGVALAQLPGEEPGKLSTDRRLAPCQVILLSNVCREVVEFDPLFKVMIDQLPISSPQGAEWPLAIVEMGEMEEERASGQCDVPALQQGQQALAVDHLPGSCSGSAGGGSSDRQEGREEVFDYDGLIGLGSSRDRPGPEREHGNSGSSLIGGELLSSQREIGGTGVRRPIVGEEDHQRLPLDPQSLKGTQQIVERSIHPFDHRGPERFEGGQSALFVGGVEAVVLFPGRVDGVVGEEEEEGARVADGSLDVPNCLACQGLRQMDRLSVVGLKTGNIPDRISSRAKILLSTIASWSPSGVSGDIDLESKVAGILPRGSGSPKMGFSDVNRPVTGLAEEGGERGDLNGSGDSPQSCRAIDIPRRRNYLLAGVVRGTVLAQRPIGDPVARGVHA
jgi:hypothetical protein